MTPPIERIEVPIRELEALLDKVRSPLGEEGYRKLRGALETLSNGSSFLRSSLALSTSVEDLNRVVPPRPIIVPDTEHVRARS
jgi:hypothetical protein